MISAAELGAYCDELLQARTFSDYCPNGIQVEGDRPIQKLVTGVTASQALIDAARDANADAILVHHGFFWKGEDPRVVGMKRRRLAALIKSGISLVAYHLPLDAHPEFGNNVQLAKRLNLRVESGVSAGGVENLCLVGSPVQPISGADFAAHLQDRLAREPMHIPGSAEPIQRIAWCTGGAQSFIELAVEQGVDAYLTGEVSEQTVHIARESGIHFFAAGHHATERYGAQALGGHLAAQFGLEHEFVDIDNPA